MGTTERADTPVSEQVADDEQASEWSGVPFIVVAVHKAPGGGHIVEACGVQAEWEAHDVATMALRLGNRAFFIDPEKPSIEEYHDE